MVLFLVKNGYLKKPEIHDTRYLILSYAFLILGYCSGALAFKKLLYQKGIPIKYIHSIQATGLSVLGKYIPGKIWAIIGRAAFISQHYRQPLKHISLLNLQNQVISLWSGLMVGLIAFWGMHTTLHWNWYITALLILFSLVMFTGLFHKLTETFLQYLLKKPITITRLSFKETWVVIPWTMGTWVFWSIAFYFFINALIGHAIDFPVGFIFPIASGLGILAVIAPGGLGIREGVIVTYLAATQSFSMTQIATISVVSRIWFLLGEMMIFLFSIALRWRSE